MTNKPPVLRDYVKAAAHFLTAPANKSDTFKSPFEQKASAAFAADFSARSGYEAYPPRKYTDLYTKYRSNPIVRRCTKLCAESVAMLEPVVKVNGQENASAAKAIAKWFKRPNPGQDRFTFLTQFTSYFKLSGNGWIEGVRGATAGYMEQYALRPERMRIVPGANGWPQSYVYQSQSGIKVSWNANFESTSQARNSRLMHIKDFAPDDDLFGAGALEAVDDALGTYENAQTLARRMFENGAVLSGMFSYEPNVPAGAATPIMTAEQREDLKKQMRERTGAKNAGKWIFAQGGLKWVPLSSNLVDLQAEEIRNNAARDVCRGFGVPSILLGIPGDLTFANFEEASRAFYRNTVFADAKRVFGALAHWWGAMTGIDLELEIDEEKVWALADELTRYWQRILSAGEALSFEEQREALGWERRPPVTDLMRNPMGGFATLDELVMRDFGLYGGLTADPAAAALPAPKKK